MKDNFDIIQLAINGVALVNMMETLNNFSNVVTVSGVWILS